MGGKSPMVASDEQRTVLAALAGSREVAVHRQHSSNGLICVGPKEILGPLHPQGHTRCTGRSEQPARQDTAPRHNDPALTWINAAEPAIFAGGAAPAMTAWDSVKRPVQGGQQARRLPDYSPNSSV
jgi:hypothetical protein